MRCSAFIAFLLVLALPSCRAVEAAPPTVRAAIHALYARLDAAYARRDVPGILAFYAPDFARQEGGVTQDLAQTRQRLADDFQGTQSVKAATRIISLSTHGGQAEAVVRRRLDLTLLKPLPDLPAPYFVVEVNRETWRKMPGGWRLAAVRETPLRHLLHELDECDQTIRRRIIADPKNPALAARMTAIDDSDRAQMKQIIQRYGWPGFDLVGTTDATIVWEIVQHSDDDKDFQKHCLPLLQAAVRRGQARPGELALLTDRILRGEGKPQLYGTQFMPGKDGRYVPYPIEHPASVDQRRASVGLAPLAEYAERLEQLYQPAPKPDAPKK